MRLALTLFVALALLSNGPPPSWWSDQSTQVAACAGYTSRFSEVMEASDKWFNLWLSLASQPASFAKIATAPAISPHSRSVKHPVREDLRIYQLKSAYLI
jgi:hypothetical protein